MAIPDSTEFTPEPVFPEELYQQGIERLVEAGERAYRAGYQEGWKDGWRAGLSQYVQPKKSEKEEEEEEASAG